MIENKSDRVVNDKLKFVFVGDEHPSMPSEDYGSRGASYILSEGLIRKDVCLVLEFLCEDKKHQRVVDSFLSGSDGISKDKIRQEKSPNLEDGQDKLPGLEEILYGKNSLRGFPECKNISFFSLISSAKEVGAKVLCGDSFKALNETRSKYGANVEPRHKAMNDYMSEKILHFLKENKDIKSFVVLCGDSHLFDIVFGANFSLSLPSLIRNLLKDQAEFRVVAQQCQSLVEFNKAFTSIEGVVQKLVESEGISYEYLPLKARITDVGYNYSLTLDRVVASNEASLEQRGGNSGSLSFEGEFPLFTEGKIIAKDLSSDEDDHEGKKFDENKKSKEEVKHHSDDSDKEQSIRENTGRGKWQDFVDNQQRKLSRSRSPDSK